MSDPIIGIIGLGYVGLPLAVEFGKKYRTIGFDINENRIKELRDGRDRTLEVEPENLQKAAKLEYTNSTEHLAECTVFIITVPTPIDRHKRPDLRPVFSATGTVGTVLKKGDIVIYESTVYPGCTEEECVPILEKESGLKYNEDFFCGYSPERINPGDKKHTVVKIKKVTSGSTPETAEKVDALYSSIIEAGTFKAAGIRVAEAAKVIENAQRDINIAFVNELAQIFNRLGIDTSDVLEAAGTKWNFLPFRPGLVGGHCIGVDPFYLTYKAQEIGHHPEIILAGRRLNDSMGEYVAAEIIKLMIKRGHRIEGAKVLVLGITFKENCPDIRNSKAVDVVRELQSFGCSVELYDPWADKSEVFDEYGFPMVDEPSGPYDGIVLLVSHKDFEKLDLKKLKNGTNTVVYDIKSFLPRELVDNRL